MSVNSKDVKDLTIIESRLFWSTQDRKAEDDLIILNSDREFKYLAFCNEIGPVDINITYKFCKKLEGLLNDPQHEGKKIVHVTSPHPSKKSNSAYLMGAFCIIVLKRSALQVTEMFSNVPVRFRDASEGTCHFFLSLSDCFQGLEHAIRRNWFNYITFDSPFYEHYSKPSNGDLNWLIPGQFLAFSSPKSDSEPLSRNSKLPASKYSEILSKLSIKTVIRLNKAKYEPSHFTTSKISHYDLHFKDGSVPCLELVDRFIDICSSNQGAVGVHCKAGLGRTGTLIGCYSIKIFKFPASAFIAWCRLCRPGSVLGPQQQFLIDYEDSVKNKKKFCLSTVGIDSTKAVLGDQNQGLRLLQAKKRRSESISEVSSVDINTPVKDEDFKVEKKENEKSCQKDGFKTPEKRCRFGYEIGKLCAKRYNGKYRNAFFYESAGKNLKTNRIYKILYGANDEDIN